MNSLITKMERTVIALAAVAVSSVTLLTATVVPANADQAELHAKLKPSVETVMVSYEPAVRATRVN